MTSSEKAVHVAVAVIENSDGQFFIAKRPEHSHQCGLWEFPGGKIEVGESVFDALKRELFEEVGIEISHATPLIKLPHDYDDKKVLLDVWKVDIFSGVAFGKEGQEVKWVMKNELSSYRFPAANSSIIKAIQLPENLMITGRFNDENELLQLIESGLKKGIKLIQFRAPDLAEEKYFSYAKKIYSLCENKQTTLLLNSSIENYKKYAAEKFSHGIHLTSFEINKFNRAQFNENIMVSTSTHNQEELIIAKNKKIDFCLLSPVKKTSTHPNATVLGWGGFKSLTEVTALPIYALGGMTQNDLITAKKNGAQGIAAIGEFWSA